MSSHSLWRALSHDVDVAGVGAQHLLQGRLTAFFASRQCPGSAIRAAATWAVRQGQGRCTVVGGFHSPLEQSILRLLLEAGGSAVMVLARPVEGASLKSAWRGALDAGTLAIVSQARSTQRLTEHAADDRNELAARLAEQIVIAYASPGGLLSRQCTRWRTRGFSVLHIESGEGPA